MSLVTLNFLGVTLGNIVGPVTSASSDHIVGCACAFLVYNCFVHVQSNISTNDHTSVYRKGPIMGATYHIELSHSRRCDDK